MLTNVQLSDIAPGPGMPEPGLASEHFADVAEFVRSEEVAQEYNWSFTSVSAKPQ